MIPRLIWEKNKHIPRLGDIDALVFPGCHTLTMKFPTSVIYLLRLLGFVAWCVSLPITAVAQSPEAAVLRMDRATVSYSSINVVDAKAQPGREIVLPDSWIRSTPSRQGVGYYTFTFSPLAPWQDAETLALFIPRVGNRFSIHLNGKFLGASGDLDEVHEDHVNTPRIYIFASSDLAAQTNVLTVEVHGELARYAGLSEVWIGTDKVVRAMYVSRNNWQNGGAIVIVGLALCIGFLALGFGFAMGSRTQTLFGSAAFFWGLRNCYVLVTTPPIAHPWWGITMDWFYGIAIVLLSSSVLVTLRAKSRFTNGVLSFLALATLVMPTIYGLTGLFAFRQYWLLMLVTGVAVSVLVVFRHWWRVKNFDSNVLMLGALFALGFALYDHLAIVHLPAGYGNFALARFAFLFILMSMSVLLMRRVVRSINAAKRFRLRLQARLDRASALLSKFHDEREKASVREAEVAERMRLLREMHDGVGAHLVSLHSLLNSPQATHQDLEREVVQAGLALRDSLDVLHGAPPSWLSVLVKLRDSMETRLAHAGIRLHWLVEDIGETPVSESQALRNVRYLISEAITNVIKHAAAKSVSLRAAMVQIEDRTELVIQVCDDGRGINFTKPATGYGIKNMAARAQALNAALSFKPLNPGTCVEIRLKLQ